MAYQLCHYRISHQPYYSLRFGPQNSNIQNHLPKPLTDSFKVEICVWHGVCSNHPRAPTLLTQIPSSRSCFELSCYSFFKELGQALLQTKLSHSRIPRECANKIILDTMNYARRLLENHRGIDSTNRSSKEIPLTLDVIVVTYSEEDYEREVMDWLMRDSTEVRMIPASEKAIMESLKRSRFEVGSEMNSQCSICFEGFNDGEEVSIMPCRHVYHRECIIHWLEKSHMCPLCRHPLSTESR